MSTKQRKKSMSGELLVIKPDGSHTVSKLTDEPTLEALHEIVGGYIERVPYFTTIEIGGTVRNCLVFCNEDGKSKGLPINRTATLAWDRALRRAGIATGLQHVPGSIVPPDHTGLSDHLVGSIAVVMGDDVLHAMMTDSDVEE